MYILKFKNRTNRASHSTPKQKSRLKRKGENLRVKYGKVWGTGRQVKKSQQESSVDDRRNLVSKMHKSLREGSGTMSTKEGEWPSAH